MKARYDKVLLIDDDEINNYLTEEVISGMDIVKEITVLTDGKQALNYLKSLNRTVNGEQEKILILLDLNMPIMDGFEFLDEFETLNHPAEFLIIVLSSSDSQKDKDDVQRYNISKFISKPITEEKLLNLLA